MAIICCCRAIARRRPILAAIGGADQLAGPRAGGFRLCRSRDQGALALASECRTVSLVDFLGRRRVPGTRPRDYLGLLRLLLPGKDAADRRGDALRWIALRAAVAAVFSRRLEHRPGRRLVQSCRRGGAGNPRQGRARLPPPGRPPRPLGGLHRSGARISRPSAA